MRLSWILGLAAITVLLFASPALAVWGVSEWGAMVWGTATSVPSLEGVGVALLAVALLAGAAWRLRRRAWAVSVLLLVLAIPLVVIAGTVTVPNTFQDGEIAVAAEMNANFAAVETAVNDNDARLAQLEQNLSQIDQMFLTTNACPSGYVAVTDGYIKLGATGLTTSVLPRTLSLPGHSHGHTLQTDTYGGHDGQPLLTEDDAGQGGGFDVYMAEPLENDIGSHLHNVSGNIGSGPSGDGDISLVGAGELERVVLRLCVRS